MKQIQVNDLVQLRHYSGQLLIQRVKVDVVESLSLQNDRFIL
jgi:hypothetical protein